MNVEIGTETPIFLLWEYLFQIFGILSLQCRLSLSLISSSLQMAIHRYMVSEPIIRYVHIMFGRYMFEHRCANTGHTLPAFKFIYFRTRTISKKADSHKETVV
jgi:hypothetical protein